jgi:hypothetical protein
MMAKDYLCGPASSVPSESLFSISGALLNKTRNRLNPKSLNH